ncbi:hypothetical protein BFP97_19030 [Roseivirga sp. 4D4]|uniref:hypothetical protein n=1 Tax=Roseivirga sp. 4D4 TaxID=1889784 RepID=UPI000852EDFE|nr:hypothetical protein [Roseivirga sp. 4D4]OEK03484.1 hypothetical protein BFP97_19030 [Roseivirga sp. 4D4]
MKKPLLVTFLLFVSISCFAQWTTTSTGIQYNGNVGIGVDPASYKFRIVSSGTDDGQLAFRPIGQEAFLHINNGNNWGLMMRSDVNSPKIGAWNGGSLFVYPYSSFSGDLDTSKGALATFNFASMRVGIGTTTPGKLLELVNSSAPTIKIRHSNEQSSWGVSLSQGDDLKGYLMAAGRDLILGAGWSNKIVIGLSQFDQYGGKVVMPYGNVGIGTSTPGEKLEVNGTIRSKKVKVEATGWPDYVFASNFKLRPLAEVASFIRENQHLPEVPSAEEMEEKGLDLGAMDATLLKKVEELTLYTIDQKKRIDIQNEKIKKQSVMIKDLMQRLKKLEKKN